MALQFTAASNQRVSITSLGNLQNVTGATLSAWVRITSVAATERYICYYSTGTSTSAARLTMGVRTDTGQFRFSARRLDADGVTSLNSSQSWVVGIEYHIAVVARYNGGALECYVNGVLSNSVAVAGWTGATSNTPSVSASFGGRGDGSAGNAFNGFIGNTRVYSRSLTSAAIGNLYVSRGRDGVLFQCVNKYNMLERPDGVVAGAVIIDSMGTGNGVAVNGPVFRDALISPRRRRSG